jgi:opacity protein-like surface antigen
MNSPTPLAVIIAAFAGTLCAQESPATPRIEVGLNYSLLHSTSPTDQTSADANGGSGYLVYNLNRIVGVVADFGAYRDSGVHGTFNGETTFTYLFGPRFTWRRWQRFTPYTQFLFGGARISADVSNPAGSSASIDDNSFALAAGGGIDIALTRHISIKPVQIEYLMTQASQFVGSSGYVQNGLRYSAGIVFRLGEK